MIQIQPPLPNTSNMSIPLGGAPSRGEKFALSKLSVATGRQGARKWKLLFGERDVIEMSRLSSMIESWHSAPGI